MKFFTVLCKAAAGYEQIQGFEEKVILLFFIFTLKTFVPIQFQVSSILKNANEMDGTFENY